MAVPVIALERQSATEVNAASTVTVAVVEDTATAVEAAKFTTDVRIAAVEETARAVLPNDARTVNVAAVEETARAVDENDARTVRVATVPLESAEAVEVNEPRTVSVATVPLESATAVDGPNESKMIAGAGATRVSGARAFATSTSVCAPPSPAGPRHRGAPRARGTTDRWPPLRRTGFAAAGGGAGARGCWWPPPFKTRDGSGAGASPTPLLRASRIAKIPST